MFYSKDFGKSLLQLQQMAERDQDSGICTVLYLLFTWDINSLQAYLTFSKSLQTTLYFFLTLHKWLSSAFTSGWAEYVCFNTFITGFHNYFTSLICTCGSCA